MAAPTPIIALDVGSHTVKVGEFQAANGALTLTRFATAPLELDPNKEDNRHAVLARAVRQALAAGGIPAGKTIFAVAGHAAFMRWIKLPAVDLMQLDKLVAFEAQQVVPFPLSEVVWDFMVLPSRGAEKEAIIVAMKADLLEEEYDSVRRTGLDPVQVDVGTLALYDSYLYNQPRSEECVLLIDMGARSTSAIFIEGDRFYTRILSQGGNTLSQQICNEFQEPFPVAETMKIERGGVSLGGNYPPQPDPDTERLWRLLRGSIGRLQGELNRSIVFYRNQGGAAPKRILLTGGGCRLPYLDHFLAEKFGVPVEFFNAFQNVGLAPTVDRAALARDGHHFGEVVGLALRRAGHVPAEISLVPRSITQGAAQKRERLEVGAALAVWALVFLLGALFFTLEKRAAQASLESLQQEVSSLQGLSGQIDPLAQKNQALSQSYDEGQRLLAARDFWPRLFNELNSRLPTGVWITQLTPTDDGQPLDAPPGAEKKNRPLKKGGKPNKGSGGPQISELEVKGMFENGLKPEVVNSFVSALADSGLFEIDKQKVSNAILSTETPSENGQLAWSYTLSLKLKEPLSLAP
ncbi:MAG: type IV pilus assembly protein PilM [Verrucomicrobium sp.]|nr:type IV pilus assembly protein PilM [Verrucomicrobium sp.]